MASTRFTNVEDYLASLDSPKQQTLRSVLDGIQRDFPSAQPKIAWNVPQVQIEGKYVFGVSAAKAHLSLAPWSEAVMADFSTRLAGYETTKGLIRVPVDWDVDHELVRDMILARLAELGLRRS
jgi:uncharacterized protein YdhG (YjbR/CyaY superfamily)